MSGPANGSYASFVAIGDSFTEGLDDPDPDPAGGGRHRGWADLVALDLAQHQPGLRYANLAVRGRLLAPIVADQVPAAVALRPDLVSLAGGTNDVLRRTCDLSFLDRLLDDAVRRLRETGADVVVFTGTDPTRRLPSTLRLLPRVQALNATVRRVADTYGALLVDLWTERVFDAPQLWSTDRLHLAPAGHQRVAAAVLERLGMPVEVDWREPLPLLPRPAWASAWVEDLRWARRHLAPWVYRRLTGRSSGDTYGPKRPGLDPVGSDAPAPR